MSEATWVAIVIGATGILGTLLGSLITHHFETGKRKSEEKRWYADYFIGRRIDALNDLYVALVDCHFTMNYYGNYSPSTLQEFKDKIQPKEEKYLMAKVKASIYLDAEADRIMSEALGAFRQASMAIWLSLPDCPAIRDSYSEQTRNLNWEIFSSSYDNAVSWFKKYFNPGVLENIAKRGNII